MNEVYVSGEIVKLQRCSAPLEADHFFFLLQVTYRDHSNQIIVDNFVVNTWNKAAKWAAQNLQAGDEVLVKGALTHMRSSNVRSTAISALRIIITQRNSQHAPQ